MANDPNPIPTPQPGKPVSANRNVQPFPMGEGLGSAPEAKQAGAKIVPAAPLKGSGNAVSGIDTAMAAQADKLHPRARKP